MLKRIFHRPDGAPRFGEYVESKPVLSVLSLLSWPRRKIRALYRWVVGWSESRQAERALGGIAFAESSFFPIPPDPLLIAMVTAHPAKFLRYAAICTLSSTVGGMFGYFIGVALFGTVGQWIIDTYGLQAAFGTIAERYEANAFLTVFAAGFTPIPYKVITVAAGVFRIDFLPFVLASILGRGGRFFLVAFLMHHFGKRYKDSIEKYIDVLSLLFVLLLVAGFLVIKHFA